MGTVVFSEQSRNDIFDIWAQIAINGRGVADVSLDKIEARCDQLADFPELGPHRGDVAEGVRVLVVERWVIVYRTTDSGVFIVRIVDGARDLSNLILPDE